MKKLTAAKRRFFENATLIAASQLIFSQLMDSGAPLHSLSDLAETTSGGTPARSVSDYYGGRIPWVKSGELNDGLISQAEEFITEEGLRNSSAKIYPKGTLVVALYGATVGKTGILTVDAASNQAVCAVIPRTKEITTRFLYWFFRYKRPEFLNNSFGGAQPNISQRILRETKLPLPSIEVQGHICEFLEAVERRQNGLESIDLPNLPYQFSEIYRTVARIEELAARIEEARELRRRASEEAGALLSSYSEELFNKCSCNFTFIESCCNVKGGIQKSSERAPGANPRRYITVAHVQRNWIDASDPRYFEVSDEELEKWRLFPGDVLVIEGNGSADQIGRTALFRGEIDDCVHQNHVIRIRPNQKKVLPDYLNEYLNSPLGQKQMRERSRTTSGLFNLSVGRIKNIEVPLPSVEAQRELVLRLQAMNSKLDFIHRLQSETSAELDALMPAVLDRAFRGEL